MSSSHDHLIRFEIDFTLGLASATITKHYSRQLPGVRQEWLTNRLSEEVAYVRQINARWKSTVVTDGKTLLLVRGSVTRMTACMSRVHGNNIMHADE